MKYTLLQIIEENLNKSSGLEKKKILANFKKNEKNVIKINNDSDITENIFEDFLKEKKYFYYVSQENIIWYYFYFENKIYLLKFQILKKFNPIRADFNFMASTSSFNINNFNDFISNYKNYNYYSMDPQLLEDSQKFWLKISFIVNYFSKTYKIKYFQFEGASEGTKKKTSVEAQKKATINSFESCRIYLKANIKKLHNSNLQENLKIILLDTINDTIKKNLKYFNQSILQIKNNSDSDLSLDNIYNEIEKKLLSFQNFEIYQKQKGIFSTLLNNLSILNNSIEELQSNPSKQKIVNLSNILNKIDIQLEQHFINADRFINVEKNNSIYKLNDKISSYLYYNFSDIIDSINIKSIKLIMFFLYKNTIEEIKNPLTESEWIIKIEAIFNNFIKKYKIKENSFEEIKQQKNILLAEIDELNSYKKINIKTFGEILKQSLLQVSNQEKTFKLHPEFEKRLSIYLKSINKNNFNTSHSMESFINKINFNPAMSFLTKNEIENSPFEIPVGWLISFTRKGLTTLLNAREKRYYNILLDDLKIPEKDIIYKNEEIIFKI